MKLLSFKNKFGWVKVTYRKKFWLFGEKFYYVTGDAYLGDKWRSTKARFTNMKRASELYDVMMTLLIKKSKE